MIRAECSSWRARLRKGGGGVSHEPYGQVSEAGVGTASACGCGGLRVVIVG